MENLKYQNKYRNIITDHFYLRDNLRVQKENMVQREHNFCIVDEVASILIYESRTPLVISGAVEDKTTLYNTINNLLQNKIKQVDCHLSYK